MAGLARDPVSQRARVLAAARRPRGQVLQWLLSKGARVLAVFQPRGQGLGNGFLVQGARVLAVVGSVGSGELSWKIV